MTKAEAQLAKEFHLTDAAILELRNDSQVFEEVKKSEKS